MANTPISVANLPDQRAADFLTIFLAEYPEYSDWAFMLRSHNVQVAKTGAEIGLLPTLGNVAKNVAACGNIATNLSQVSSSKKIFAPVEKSMHLPTCYEDLAKDTVFGARRPAGNSMADLMQNPDFVDFMMARGMQGYIKDVLCEAWFGDTTNTDAGSGSGTQTLTPGAGYGPYVNQNNGFFKQLAALVTAGTIGKYTITANSAATKADQFANLTTENALDALYGAYLAATPLALDQPNLAFQCTASIYHKAVVYLSKQSNANGFGTTIVNGRELPTLLNIPIIMRPDWDYQINEKFNNGTTLDRPHRVVLAPITNLFVGLETVSEAPEIYLDRPTRYTYTDFSQRFDYLILDDQLASVAW